MFGHVGQWQCMRDLEDLLEAAGITHYVKFIAAYNIHGKKNTYPAEAGYEFCPLDWYTRPVFPGDESVDVWEHHLLLDVVSPKEWYAARQTEKMPKYPGWPGLRIGARCIED